MADENMRENTELEDEVLDKGKDIGEAAAKGAAKGAAKVGKQAVKGAAKLGAKAAKGLGHLVASGAKAIIALGPVAIGITVGIIIIAIVIMLNPWQKLKNVWENVKGGVYGVFAVVFNLDLYDEEPLTQWRDGGDPYGTFQLLTAMEKQYEKNYDGGDGIQIEGEDALGPDELKELEDAKEDLEDSMEYEQVMLAPEDMLDILRKTNEENEQMFTYRTIWYTPQIWYLTEKYTGTDRWWAWEKSEDREYNTRDDEKYGIVTNENFRGEEFGGEKIYALHWPEIMAMAYFYGNEKYGDKGWGTDDSSEYIDTENRVDDDGTIHVLNNTDNYFLTDEEVSRIFNMFRYTFSYRYDAVEEGKNHETSVSAYKFPEIANGNVDLGYRYARYDRQDYHDDIYDEGFDGYRPDKPDYEDLTTEFVPDIAPKSARNKIENYIYMYIPVDEVEDYTPDPDCFEPPNGEYCIGKWKIVDPEPFITEMADLCHYYKDIDSEYKQEKMKYDWATEMIDRYAFYLDFLSDSADTPASAGEYYRNLVELYNNKEIEVYYYGMQAPDAEMDEFIEAIIEAYPGKAIKFVDYENAKAFGEYYEVDERDVKDQASEGGIPFPCYGVTYSKRTGTGSGDISGHVDVEDNYVGDFYVSEHGEYYVDGWASLREGADVALDSNYSYTEEQISRAVSALAAKGNSYTYPSDSSLHAGVTYYFDWHATIKDIHKYNQETGVDVIALLAIVYTEYTPRVGFPSWNWFNLTAGSGRTVFKRSSSDKYNWWDAASDVSVAGYETKEGACMVECMKDIVRRYWHSEHAQNTYFKMQWNRYGWDPESGTEYLPQNWDEAVVAEAAMEGAGHCYCPWWEDSYVTTGYASANLWCNKCAKNRDILLNLSGLGGIHLGDRVDVDFGELPSDLAAIINMSLDEIFPYLVNDANARYSDYAKFTPEVEARLQAAQAANEVSITFPVRQWEDPSDPTNMNTVERTMTIRINKVIAPLVEAAMTKAYEANDGTVISSWDGSYDVRSMRTNSSATSAHAFGAAIDFNSTSTSGRYSNALGKSTHVDKAAHDSMAENHAKYEVFYDGGAYVEAFKHYGFYWGGDFSSSKDGMHFGFVGDHGNKARQKGQENAANH